MSSSATQFTLRFLLLMVAFVGMVCAALISLPPFPKFVPSFPYTVFAVSFLAALLPAFVISLIRHPLGTFRFWLSLMLAVMAGAWSGVLSGYHCNESYRHQVQWPNIGGALMVWIAGMFAAFVMATIAALIVPRRRTEVRD